MKNIVKKPDTNTRMHGRTLTQCRALLADDCVVVATLQAVFETASAPFWEGLLVIAIGVALFAIIETEKQIRLRAMNTHNPAIMRK